MNPILQMQQDKTAQIKAAEAILAKAQTEKRLPTAEERSQIQTATDKATEIAETLALMERTSALAGNAYNDGCHTEDRSLAKPFGPEARSGESVKQKRARLALGFGEQLQAVRNAAMYPHRIDQRLLDLNARSASGASETVPSDGGFLVYPDFSEEILRIAHDTGLVYNLTRNIPLSETTNAIKIPAIDEQSRADGSRWGGVRMYWQNEADATTASKPKFRQIELVCKKLMGLFYSTDELLADSRALGFIVGQAFGEEVGFKLDDAVINGDGSGKPLGVLASGALITITKESGQAANTVLFQNVTKMWYRLHARSRKNAIWFVNQDTEQQLLQMSLLVGTAGGSSVVAGVAPVGASVYQPAGFNGNVTALLFGRPVVPIEQCASLSSAGDIILMDPTQYVMVDKGDVQQAISMHVAFLTDQMAFRWVYRVDGQPWWHTAITPFKGSNTQSPFITLGAR